MNGSMLLSFLLVAFFFFVSSAAKSPNKKGTNQSPAQGAPGRPDAKHPAPSHRPAAGENGDRNAPGGGAAFGAPASARKGPAFGGDRPVQSARFGRHAVGSASNTGLRDYVARGGELSEGASQWPHFSGESTAAEQENLPKGVRAPRPALDQLIPLHGEDLLKGVVFSEILSRRSEREW